MSLERHAKKKRPRKKYLKKICFLVSHFRADIEKHTWRNCILKAVMNIHFRIQLIKKKTFLIFKVIYREYFFLLLFSFRNIWITDNGHGKFDEGCFLLFLYEMLRGWKNWTRYLENCHTYIDCHIYDHIWFPEFFMAYTYV